MVFNKVEHLDVRRFSDPDIPGYQVSLPLVVTWQLRELRLHGKAQQNLIQMNLRLDGRPFAGNFYFVYFFKILAHIPPLLHT